MASGDAVDAPLYSLLRSRGLGTPAFLAGPLDCCCGQSGTVWLLEWQRGHPEDLLKSKHTVWGRRCFL